MSIGSGLACRNGSLMKIHEYQAKQILRDAGVAVPRGIVADTPQDAADAFHALGGTLAVVKAQIHAGGRGKGTIQGNPRAARRAAGAQRATRPTRVAGNLLGHTLVTIQTGPEGQVGPPRAGRSRAATSPASSTWASWSTAPRPCPVLMASSEGGMEIEEVAAETPELIFREPFHPDAGLQSYQVRKLAGKLGLAAAGVALGREVHAGPVPACSSTAIAAWSRSTRWSSPPTASCWRWTPR